MGVKHGDGPFVSVHLLNETWHKHGAQTWGRSFCFRPLVHSKGITPRIFSNDTNYIKIVVHYPGLTTINSD